MTVLTVELAREYFAYDPKTGVVTWSKRDTRHVKVGDIAGWVDTSRDRQRQYLMVSFRGQQFLLHRVIMGIITGVMPAYPEYEVDHENGNGLDNRQCNLRLTTKGVNLQNKRRYSNNTSGCCGISFRASHGTWRARIAVNGKEKHLGTFENEHDAIAARKDAEHQFGYHENHGNSRG
jgi:hypothetical protein